MRTTLTIDDRLMRKVKEAAHREGIPLKQMIDHLLRLGLERSATSARKKPYRCPTFAMGEPLTGNLDKALALAGDLEDDEVLRKLAMRK